MEPQIEGDYQWGTWTRIHGVVRVSKGVERIHGGVYPSGGQMFSDESLCSIPVKPSGGVADTGEVDAS